MTGTESIPAHVMGFINLNKPPGPTSHDVVAWVRRGTGVRRVGHAGTLDPMASGVLVLGLGPATRLLEYLAGSAKRYLARVRLGVETDTYDAEGRITAERPFEHVGRADVEQAMEAFRGEIEQVPPMYSALKRGGKPLYRLARAGQEVKLEPRPVTIYSLELVGWEPPFVILDVECSPGTYIRSLAHDLGRALGCGAHLAGLVRTASGDFRLDDAIRWAEFEAAMRDGSWPDLLISPGRALAFMPKVTLGPDDVGRVAHGQAIKAREFPSERVRAHDEEGHLVAILEADPESGVWRPRKVFPPRR